MESSAASLWAERATYAALVALGALLFWLSRAHPSLIPFWAPWDFSPSVYLATALTLTWYWRGIVLSPLANRPPLWQQISFFLGVALIYAVLQTRFEYWSQHMFFLNRAQNVAMHDLGPFFIALGWPGATIKAGMPEFLRRMIEGRTVAALMRPLHQPIVAVVLFVGFFYFWLIPSVHFRTMIDHDLYMVMNWTMILGGLLFWCLVLDPRPKLPAPVSYWTRMALSIAIMFPTVLIGALLAFMPRDLYPYYDLCGRLFPSIGPLADQQIGAIISWIPPGMISLIGVLLVLNNLRLHEEATKENDDVEASMARLSNSWR
ncbi:MAG: cytochrome c oxidase assembly protein [Methylovirgula sp.]|jgi:putative membrane protein